MTRIGQVAWIVATLFVSTVAHAQVEVQHDATPAVETTIACDDLTNRAALVTVITERLSSMGVATHASQVLEFPPLDPVTPQPTAEPRLSRVWIDAHEGTQATIFLVDGSWERILVRHVPTPHGLDEVARETLAHIVEDGVEAIRSGVRIGLTREQARAQLSASPAPVSPPTRSPREHLDIAAYYSIQSFSGPIPFVHGPGLAVRALARVRSLRLGLSLDAHYRFAVATHGTPVDVTLEQGSLRAFLYADGRLSPRVGLMAALGGGADYVAITPTRSDTGFSQDSAQTLWVPIVSAMVGIRVSIVSHVELEARVGCDADISQTYYYVQDASQQTTVLAPWIVRPTIELGLAFWGLL